MFDAYLAEERECVGERRSRKGRHGSRTSNNEGGNSIRDPNSQRSSVSSGDRSLNFFGGFALKKGTTSLRTGKSRPTSLQTITDKAENRTKFVKDAEKTDSCDHETPNTAGVLSSFSIPRSPGWPKRNSCLPDTSLLDDNSVAASSWAESPVRSSKDSVFSKMTNITALTTDTSLIGQALDLPPARGNTRRTGSKKLDVVISKEPNGGARSTDIQQDSGWSRSGGDPLSDACATLSFMPDTPRPNRLSAENRDGDANARVVHGISSRNVTTTKPPARCIRRKTQRIRRHAKSNLNSPQSWRTPNDWDQCARAGTFKSMRPMPNEDDLGPLQARVKDMMDSSYDKVLAGLTQRNALGGDGLDYRNMEVERKQWMLAAMLKLNGVNWNGNEGERVLKTASNVLVLYESSGLSYVTAFYHKATIVHVAHEASFDARNDNVQPWVPPLTQAESSDSSDPNRFDLAFCRKIATLFPSQDIPRFLKSIHGSLTRGGQLRVVLLDPAPVASTAGPLLREWLDDYLLLHMEEKFRCVKPSKLIPKWLKDAGFQISDSNVIKGLFSAVVSPLSEEPSEDCGEQEKADKHQAAAVRKELETLTGRALWQDAWGTFVAAPEWFWDVPAIVNECLEYGTQWEYLLVRAINGA